MSGFRLFSTALFVTVFAGDLFSATAIPGLVQPGQIEKQFQRRPEIRKGPDGLEVPLRRQEVPEGAGAAQFVVKHIQLNGFFAYSAEELAPYLEPLLHRSISLSELYQLANALTIQYRSDGYILSQVFVPSQQIDNGTARLQAVEGFIDSVYIDGAIIDKRDLVRSYANKIKNTRPLTSAALERYMLLINDLPGVFAKAVLAPSPTAFGAADLTVQVSGDRFSGSLGVDNRGGKSLGPYRILGNIRADNLFGVFDRAGLQIVQTTEDELTYFSLYHERQIGTEGGKLLLDGSLTLTDPEELSFIPLELETESKTFNLVYSYPYLRSRNRNLYLRGGLRIYDGETSLFGIDVSEDSLRVLKLGLAYDFVDRTGAINLIDIEFSQGLTALGASDNDDIKLSIANGQVDFSKLNIYAARLQPLSRHWSLLTALTGQFTDDDLLSPEQFGFGGVLFGRGYDPSEFVADNGTALKLELRYQDKGPYSLYGFYDVGWVWRTHDTPSDDNDHSDSAGIGAQISLGTRFTANLEFAKPMSKTVTAEGDNDVRGYFSLAAYF